MHRTDLPLRIHSYQKQCNCTIEKQVFFQDFKYNFNYLISYPRLFYR